MTVTSTLMSQPEMEQLLSGKVWRLYPTQDRLTIRYTMGGEDEVHESLLSWFELKLPAGKPVPIEYPYRAILTATLKQTLGLSDTIYGAWFDQLRISPSGTNILYFKGVEIIPECPACSSMRWELWQANSDGSGTKLIMESYTPDIENIVWSRDETIALVAINPLETSGMDNLLVDLGKNSWKTLDIFTDIKLETFYPFPTLAPDKCCIAGIIDQDFENQSLKIWDIRSNAVQIYKFNYLASTYPLWSEDGKFIYFLGREGQLYQFKVADKTVTHLARIDQFDQVSYHQYFNWLIFPEQKMLVIGGRNGLWLVRWQEPALSSTPIRLTPLPVTPTATSQ